MVASDTVTRLSSIPTCPTLFHQMYWSSSRPAAVLMELDLIKTTSNKDDDDKHDDSKPIELVTVTEEQLKNDPILIKLNPQKRLPFFYDPTLDIKLNESGGMIQYLLDTYDTESKLQPSKKEDDKDYVSRKAEFYKLLHFGPATMYHIGVPIFGHDLGFAKLDEDKLQSKLDEWKNIVIPTLEYSLEKFGGPYLLGEQYTAVDCSISYDMITIGTSSYAEELLTCRPLLKSYFDALRARPVYKKLYGGDSAEKEADEANKTTVGEKHDLDTKNTEESHGEAKKIKT